MAAAITKTATATKTAAAAAQVASNASTPVEPVQDSGALDFLMGRYAQAQTALLEFFNAPSWKRTLVALITLVAGYAGTLWFASALAEYAMAGAIALGAHLFIGIAIAALGAAIVAYYGHRLVVRVTGAILTKEADERAAAAYAATKNMLRRFNPFVKMVPAEQAEPSN